MTAHTVLKTGALLFSVLALSACSGGSDSGGGNGNQAPVANAGPDQSVDELSTVNLSGSGTDPNTGATLSYAWTQRSGVVVTLIDANTATPSFTAPDVTAVNTPETLVFRLTVSDGSLSGTDDVSITVNDAGLGENSPPAADAGPDRDVAENTVVDLDGSGSSDPDGDALGYSWVQTGGQTVALTGANTAAPSFTAPNVAPGTPETLVFELTVDDGTDTATDSVDITVFEGLSAVDVSGVLRYERPTPNFRCNGFNFNNITNMPVRQATVILLDEFDNVLATTISGDDGAYAFSGINANTNVRVRARAQVVRTGGVPSYEIYVRDNTSNTGVPLANRPIYDVDFALFNTGVTHVTDKNFLALTGWGAASYTGIRQAAPLAILDALLDGTLLVTSVDPDVDLGRIDAFWSVNNSWVDDADDVDNGQLITAFYTSNPDGGARNPSLFLRGDAEGRFPDSHINTDEFDYGVVLHEWGHFFEDELSRSDSIGGVHYIPGVVEARVAFGEGWGNAIAAIASDRPVTCDTAQPASSGSDLDVESFNSNAVEQGFFNEMSVATFLYDLYDTDVDSTDTDSIGFGPIYDTMTGFQKDTDAFTTLFSFGTGLLANVDPADVAFVESQLNRENVDTVLPLDEWATNQATRPSAWRNGKTVRDLLPLYTDLVPGGPVVNLCVNDDQVIDQDGNKPGEWRYLRVTTTGAARSWRITVQANPVPPPTSDPPPGEGELEIRDRADPDIYLYRNGVEQGRGWSGDDDVEAFDTPSLSADTYTLAMQDWRYQDPQKSSDYPSQVCFDITMN